MFRLVLLFFAFLAMSGATVAENKQPLPFTWCGEKSITLVVNDRVLPTDESLKLRHCAKEVTPYGGQDPTVAVTGPNVAVAYRYERAARTLYIKIKLHDRGTKVRGPALAGLFSWVYSSTFGLSSWFGSNPGPSPVMQKEECPRSAGA